jgi:DNA-binding transcriptional LysR family regulator
MDRLQSMRVFQQVVDEGGFAAAARKLALAPAVVTRLVGDLEAHLGVRLLQRTTRRLSLTPAGEAYLARLRPILAEIEEADAMAHAHSREMSGSVRILSTPMLASYLVAPAAVEFQRLHPEVLLDVEVRDVTDPNVEEYDLAVVTDIAPIHSTAIVRTIHNAESVLCASPSYLARRGAPATPEDLAQHSVLRLRVAGLRARPVTLIDPTYGDRQLTVEAPMAMCSNHGDLLLRATLEGAGISSQPIDLVAGLLKAGQLKRVLAPWITNRIALVAALPSRKFLPARTRAFVDHLAMHARTAVAGLGA